jgi:hypothetical protein
MVKKCTVGCSTSCCNAYNLCPDSYKAQNLNGKKFDSSYTSCVSKTTTNSNSNISVGIVLGGAFGGFAAFILIIVIFVFICRKITRARMTRAQNASPIVVQCDQPSIAPHLQQPPFAQPVPVPPANAQLYGILTSAEFINPQPTTTPQPYQHLFNNQKSFQPLQLQKTETDELDFQYK